jgi:hypothetical protein
MVQIQINVTESWDGTTLYFSDTTLLDLLESVATYGIALIDKTPPKEDQLRRIANKVGFIKRTHYG